MDAQSPARSVLDLPPALAIFRGLQGGAVAQLGERLVRNEEVRGSIPLSSTTALHFTGQLPMAPPHVGLPREIVGGRQKMKAGVVRTGEWMRRAATGLALLSGLAALAALLLPLLLVLLMLLFDNTAHGLMLLLQLLFGWLAAFLPSNGNMAGNGSGLSSLEALAFHPLDIALNSLLRALPCMAGLALILLDPKPGARWWGILLLWGFSAAIGGEAVAALLLPGLAVAALFTRAGRQH